MRTCRLLQALSLVLSLATIGAAAKPPAPSHGVDLSAIDPQVNPCQDFYMYACGNWKKNNPIPADKPIWGRFEQLEERNLHELRGLLQQAAQAGAKATPLQRKVGDFYAACMNRAAIGRRGAAPLRPTLAAIAALRRRTQLPALVARLQREGAGAGPRFYAYPDAHNVMHVIANVDQGGLGLPSRSYYLKTDAHSVKLRQQYLAYAAKLFELAGKPRHQAEEDAAAALRLETDLAQAARSRVWRRDPNHTYHRMSLRQLQQMTPGWNWKTYFRGVDAPAIGPVNVASRRFVRVLNHLAASEPLPVWRAYLELHALSQAAPYLSHPFVAADFNFNGRILEGAKKNLPRWERCTRYTDRQLGMALGRLYVQRYFPPQAKAKALRMVEAIQAALGSDIQQLTWMTPATKQKALIKLHAIANMIGYPHRWRDYRPLAVSRRNFYADIARSAAFNLHRDLVKIGHPLDRHHWQMTPPTVNAYYSPTRNIIVFPAGILQPPFYDPYADAASNLGAMGVVIGHENTHGFDDEGSRYGPHGNLHNWWTAADKRNFDQRERCLVKEYSGFTVNGRQHLNGRLTLGENTADNGGIRIAFMALLTDLAKSNTNIYAAAPGSRYSPAQRFFLSYGQIWCENATPQIQALRARVDPHSPGRYRVNGVVSNFNAFAHAFHCGPGSAMVRGPKACRVW